MSQLRPSKEVHEPNNADYRESFDWQQSFEESGILRDAIGPTERYAGAGIEVMQQTAFYKSTDNEMLAMVELGIQVDVSLRTDPRQAYWQIAKAFAVLSDEMLRAMGEDTDATVSDVLPEPDECGQAWHGAVATGWVWFAALLFGGVLAWSALKWNGII